MNKILDLGLVLICLAGGIYLATDSSNVSAEKRENRTARSNAADDSPQKEIPPEQHICISQSGSSADQPQQQSPEIKTVSHTAVDFQEGQLDNVVVAAGRLSLGSDGTPLVRLDRHSRLGFLTSSEESTADVFNTISIRCQAVVPPNSELRFEFRTRSVDGDWSMWLGVDGQNTNQSFTLNSQASSWQYRIALRADGLADSPQLQGVTVSTQFTEPVNSEANAPNN